MSDCSKTRKSAMPSRMGGPHRPGRDGPAEALSQPYSLLQARTTSNGIEFSHRTGVNHGPGGRRLPVRAYADAGGKKVPPYPSRCRGKTKPKNPSLSTKACPKESKANPNRSQPKPRTQRINLLKSECLCWLFEREPKLNPTEPRERTQSRLRGSARATPAGSHAFSGA